jgi:hypothetical protein
MVLADMPADAAAVVFKILSYADYFANDVIEIESATTPPTEK